MSRFKVSNHDKHFWGGMAVALVFTILAAIGCAGGMEFKDKQYGGKFDWRDIGWTILGGLIGQAIQLSIILMVVHLCK